MSETTLDQVLTQRRESRQEIVNVDEPTVKLVIFALGEKYFAFHGERIREILAQADVFFVPGSPASLEGVINVRGDIESVIRPHEMLHLPENNMRPAVPPSCLATVAA
jgi:purine-binding chemotaxis protein CheW